MLDDGPSNEPWRMRRVQQGVQFHNEATNGTGGSINNNKQQQQQQQPPSHHQYTSHELDAKDMRAILTQLFVKTLDMRKRQKDAHQHHHREGTFREDANIDKPPTFDDTEFMQQELLSLRGLTSEATSDSGTDMSTGEIAYIYIHVL